MSPNWTLFSFQLLCQQRDAQDLFEGASRKRCGWPVVLKEPLPLGKHTSIPGLSVLQHNAIVERMDALVAEASDDVRVLARLWQLQNKMQSVGTAGSYGAPHSASIMASCCPQEKLHAEVGSQSKTVLDQAEESGSVVVLEQVHG